MFGVSQELPKQTLIMEVMQVKQADEAFSVGKKVERLSRQPVISHLPVRQIPRSVSLASPDLLEAVVSHIKRNWIWYVVGSVAFVFLIALATGSQKDER